MITGAITVNEGGNLTLDCDTSNFQLPLTVMWFNPQGEIVTGQRELEIENIIRTQAGQYQCVAIESESGGTGTSSVDVTVQCE